MTADPLEIILATESAAIDPAQIGPITGEVKRIALFTEAFLPKVDGVSRTALLAVKYLEMTGRDLIVFAPAPCPDHISRTPVYAIPSLWLPSYPDSRVGLIWPPLLRQLRRFQPDLIHLFSPFSLGVMGLLAGGLMRVPVVANYQTDLPGYTRSYGVPALRGAFIGALRFIHNGCHLTLAPSPATYAELRGWRFRRLRLWGRGVDADRFDPGRKDAVWRARLLAGRDPNRLVALYVGRLAREKHLDTLRDLCADPRLALVLVGEGNYRQQVAAALPGAHFLGHLNGDALANAYAAADMFVFPGPEETFGQVVLEGMASGLPVIVADRGGPASFVRHGETGLICQADSASDFHAAALRLYADPVLRERMGAAARLYAQAQSWMAIMAQLERYYGEAFRLQRHRARAAPRPRKRWLEGVYYVGAFAPFAYSVLAAWITAKGLGRLLRVRR